MFITHSIVQSVSAAHGSDSETTEVHTVNASKDRQFAIPAGDVVDGHTNSRTGLKQGAESALDGPQEAMHTHSEARGSAAPVNSSSRLMSRSCCSDDDTEDDVDGDDDDDDDDDDVDDYFDEKVKSPQTPFSFP